MRAQDGRLVTRAFCLTTVTAVRYPLLTCVSVYPVVPALPHDGRRCRDGTLEMRKSTQHSELVEEAVTILGTDGEVVSPRLYRRLVMATFELAMAVVVPDELLLFTVLMRAGDVLSRLRDPCAITVRRRQCEEAIKLLHADKYPRAKFLAESAHTALFEAVAMSNTFYGEQHEQSVGLQRDYLSLVRQVKRAR